MFTSFSKIKKKILQQKPKINMNKNKLQHDKVKSNVQVAPKCDDLNGLVLPQDSVDASW